MRRRHNPPLAFIEALEMLAPGKSNSQRAVLFGPRVNRYHVKDWTTGGARPPQWAVDVLKNLLAKRQAALDAIKTACGKAPNIVEWNKKRAAEKAALNTKVDSVGN
jgi:hypothetical protein